VKLFLCGDNHLHETYTGCSSVLDLVLLLDLSGSVLYEPIMEFSRALALNLNINSDAVRIGVVTFADNVSNVILLDQFIQQQRNFIEALNFRQHRGETNIQVTDNIHRLILTLSASLLIILYRRLG